jgi:glycosyltransferase involved in cell wall biosynthesis
VKILFVHEVNWRKKPIYEIHDYPELLSLRGHEINFIDFPEGEKLFRFRVFKNFKTNNFSKQSRAHKNSNVKLLTPGRVVFAPFDRLVHSITFVPLLLKTLRSTKFDVIVLYGVPTNGWQTVLIAKLLRVPVLYRAIDVSYELRKTRFRPIIKLAERIVCKFSDAVSVNNPSLAKHCISFGASETSVTVDYPGLDLNRFSPKLKNETLRESLKINLDENVVVFMGTLYRFAGMAKLLDLATETLRARPKTKFLILGDGEARNEIETLISNSGLQNQVILTGFISYDELPDYLNLADVAFNSFEIGVVTNNALPWKVVQYLACGLPTVATPLSGLTAYTGIAEDNGVTYRDLDSTFVTEIFALLDNPNRRQEMAKQARDLVVTQSSWSNCLERFENLLESMAKRK